MGKRRQASSRKQRLRAIGESYWKHALAFAQGRCIYCGDKATTDDHVPAVEWLYALGTAYFQANGISPLLVPSCARCNSWLGAKPYHSIRQRKGYIASRLRSLSLKILDAPKWEQDEIDEMGFMMRSILNDREAVKEYLARRIDWAQTTFRWDEV